MKNRRRSGGNAAFLAPLYLFTVIFLIGPFVYMIVLSFLTRAETWGVVHEFTLDNYAKILKPLYLSTFGRSLKLALEVTVLIALTGYPFGYYMAKLPPKRRARLLMLVMIPFYTSSLMRMYGWIIIFRANGLLDKFLLALHVIERPLKMLYTYPAVVIGMVYALLPFMMLSVYSSVEKMDWSLVEAARDMGASPRKAFFTITLPLTMPGLMTGVILSFIPSMGLFFVADILGGNKIVLVGNVIQEQLLKVHDWPFAAALSVVLMVMMTVMIWLYHRITGSKEMEGMI